MKTVFIGYCMDCKETVEIELAADETGSRYLIAHFAGTRHSCEKHDGKAVQFQNPQVVEREEDD